MKKPGNFLEELLKGLEGIPVSSTALLGASGGRDSTALAHGLARLGFRKVTLCHLHHGLRGAAADADLEFVGKTAAALGFGFNSRKADLRRIAKTRRLSIEEAGRVARARFFAEMARKHKAEVLLLAHHAEDQAETMLHHLFRGAGLQGFLGMESRSPLPGYAKNRLTVVRPMLAISRSTITAFLETGGISWREDESNLSADFTRNRIRNEALPLLRNIFRRDPAAALLRIRKILSAENEFLEHLAGEAGGKEVLEVKELASLHPALQRRTIHHWLKSRGFSEADFDLVERVRTMLDPGTGPAKINLPGGAHARRTTGKIYVWKPPGVV